VENSLFKVSTFGLAKGRVLVSEDFAAVKVIDDLCIGIVCDGVGSALAGGKAARRVVNYLMNNFKTRPRSWSIEKSLRHFIDFTGRMWAIRPFSFSERATCRRYLLRM